MGRKRNETYWAIRTAFYVARNNYKTLAKFWATAFVSYMPEFRAGDAERLFFEKMRKDKQMATNVLKDLTAQGLVA